MSFDAGSVTARFLMDDSDYQKGMKKVDKSSQNLTKSFIDAQLAVKGLSFAFNFVKDNISKTIKTTSDLQEETNKFNVVFGKVGASAKKMQQDLQKSYGLSELGSKKLLAATGDLLTGFGVQQDKALELSGTVNKLAVDLASFTNFSGGAEGASAALTKALLGERESMKSLGISINETDLMARLAAEGKDKLTGMALRQAKAEMTLTMAMEQSKNAIGDFARSSDSFANIQRQLNAETENMQSNLGTFLLPVITDISKSFLEGARGINEWLTNAENMSKVTAIFEVVKQVLIDLKDKALSAIQPIIDTVKNIWNEWAGDVKDSTASFNLVSGIINTIGAGMAILGQVIAYAVRTFADLVNVIINASSVVGNFFAVLAKKKTWDDVKDSMESTSEAIKKLGTNWLESVGNIVDTTKEQFSNLVINTKTQSDNYSKIWENTQKKVLQTVGATQKQVDTLVQQTVDSSQKAGAKISEFFEGTGGKILNNIADIGQKFASMMNDIFGIVATAQQNELAIMQDKHSQEITALEEQKDAKLELQQLEYDQQLEQLTLQRENNLITQEEYDAKVAVLEQSKATKTAQIEADLGNKIAESKKRQREKENAKKKEIFEAQKANQIANIWIQYAIGLVGLWAQSISSLGPIAGSILAGIMTGVLTGIAIAQTVVISQQQFIPEREKGGMASGMTRINEKGGEIVTLPDGSQVIPNDISRQIAVNSGGASGNNISVSFRGAQISDNMSLRKVSNFVSRDIAKQLRARS